MLTQEELRHVLECDEDDVEVMQLVLQSEGLTQCTLCKCLWVACRKGKLNSAKLLLDYGTDVAHINFYGRTMLMACTSPSFAPDSTRLKLAKLLVQHGADPSVADIEDKTALHYAVKFDRQSLTVWLCGFFDDRTLSDAFLFAVQHNNIYLAKHFLSRGVDVNFHAVNNIQGVVMAACRENVDMLSMLLDRGANVNAAVGTGATALHFAARKRVNVVRLLLQRGADVNALTMQRNTALHNATEEERVDNVAELLRYKSDPNAENESGETPLLMACKKGNYALIKLLLENGSRPNTSSSDVMTPLNTIIDRPDFNDFSFVDLLLKYGACINGETGVHPLPLLCYRNKTVSFKLVQGLILRGARLPCISWFDFVQHQPTVLKLAVWAICNKKAAMAYFYTFVYGEEKGVRPVPVPRRLTGAYGLYPIRRRLAAYLVQPKASIRYMIEQLVDQF